MYNKAFNVDPSKTEDHFKGLPVFGTVESIIDQNGRELLKWWQNQIRDPSKMM